MHFPIFEQMRNFKLKDYNPETFRRHFINQLFEEDMLDFIIW